MSDPGAPSAPPSAHSDGPETTVDAVRARPAMYIGSTGPRGLAHLGYALLHHALIDRQARQVGRVTVHTGPLLTVADDGVVSVPAAFERWTETAQPPADPLRHDSVEAIPHVILASLSSVATLVIDHDRRWQQVFVQGHPVGPPVDLGPALGRGTFVALLPDKAIFKGAEFDVDALRKRMQELAILYPDLTFELNGAPLPSFGGLAGYARALAGDATAVRYRKELVGDILIEVAIAHGDPQGPSYTCTWANGLPTDGEHRKALEKSLRKNEHESTVALLAVTLPYAEYYGRARRTLVTTGLKEAVTQVVRRALDHRRPGSGEG